MWYGARFESVDNPSETLLMKSMVICGPSATMAAEKSCELRNDSPVLLHLLGKMSVGWKS